MVTVLAQLVCLQIVRLNCLPKEANLCTLYYQQIKELNINDKDTNSTIIENCVYISGHLAPEYNKIAYENIDFYIQNKYWDWKIPKESIIVSENKDNYYVKI